MRNTLLKRFGKKDVPKNRDPNNIATIPENKTLNLAFFSTKYRDNSTIKAIAIGKNKVPDAKEHVTGPERKNAYIFSLRPNIILKIPDQQSKPKPYQSSF